MLDFEDTGEMSDKALFKGVRVSKYRHVYGSVARKDQCYDNINITKNAHDSLFCAVNPKFLAIVTESCGGGSFIIIPIDKAGRIDATAGRVTGHRGQIYDIKWNPFNDNVIASGSDDCTIKLWYIPDEGFVKNMTQPIAELKGHKRRINFIEWHPTADNILLSAGSDYIIIVWNTLTMEAVRTINCHNDTIHSMSFNRDGSLLATTSKDKKLRIIDPRNGDVINEGLCHHGTKASKVVYLGDSTRLFTVGFSRYSDRQWAIWSEQDLSAPLTIENIDSSSGVLFPYYDHDTRMVYVAGKGDGNIRYYETTDEHPYCHYLSQFLSGMPQRSLGMMPKRGCDVYKCELTRFYKLHATKPICEPISMIVPRKSEQFQSDVFPDTAAPTPALTADQWLSGQNRNPVLFNLKSGAGAKTNKPIFIQAPFSTDKSAMSFNGERKLEFISQANPIDYREKEYLEDHPKNTTNHHNGNQIGQVNHEAKRPIKQNGLLAHSQSAIVNKTNVPPAVDPKSKIQKNESALLMNFHQSIQKANTTHFGQRKRLPWVKDEMPENVQSKPMCDIVNVKQFPHANYVTISNQDQQDDEEEDEEDSDDSAADTTDDSIAEELAFSSTMNLSSNNNSQNQNETNNNSQESLCNDSSNNQSPASDDSLENDKDNQNNKVTLSPIKNDLINKQVDNPFADNPKNERELWCAFHEQRAMIHNLQTQINDKNKRIVELEQLLRRCNHAKDY